jgi:hypothetical protein
VNDNDTLHIIQIDPIEMRTAGGFRAEIWAVTPNEPEAFIGTVAFPRRTQEVRWADTGICQGHDEECNLVSNTFEFANILMLRQLQLTQRPS